MLNINLQHTKASNKEWIGLAVLALPTLLVSMDMTVMYLAVPSLSAAIKPSNTQLLWSTDVYTFAEAGFLITMGTLGDKIGSRKLLLIGAFAFTVASVFTAFTNNSSMLIIGRAVLGVCGATLLPSIMSLIRAMFQNAKQRTFAFGIWTMCFSIGTMLGPFVGGLLLNRFWWGSVFLVSVPLMILLLVLAPVWLPEARHPSKQKFDIISAFLSLGAILPMVYSIKEMAQGGNFNQLLLLPIIGSVIIGVLFIRRQQTLNNPMIDLSLFRRTEFSITLITLLLAIFAWAGLSFFIAQHLQLVMDMSPLWAGLWTMPAAAISALGCMIAPQAAKKYRRGFVMATGLIIMVFGMLLLSQITITSGLPLIVVASFLLSFGCGIVVTLGHDMVISSAPVEKAGIASGISETSTTLGAALGIALLGSIVTAVYHYKISYTTSDLFSDKAGVELIKSSFDVAVPVIKKLPQTSASSMLVMVREAFDHSFNVVAAISATLITIAAIAVAYTSRRLKTSL